MKVNLRKMNESDPKVISEAFKNQGWEKPSELYDSYYEDVIIGKRAVIVALIDNEFVGYLTVLWQSSYPHFKQNRIPEITDFNVLIKFRGNGVGTLLMDKAESIIKEKFEYAGIRVGMYTDYGAAQRLYVKRGYIPDGLGIHYKDKQLKPYENTINSDDLTLGFTKNI